tara:strand:- start:402 stop:746 length:345 start_codon:yes stop_codon:yes gene_type:complete
MKEYELNDTKYYVGENAKENWEIFDKSIEINKKYIWFHLNSFASPYVIMYATMDEIETMSDVYLKYGATLCLENSKYSYLIDAKIIYSELNKLKKGEKEGEIIISGKKKLIKII